MAEVSVRKVVKEYDAGVQAVKGIDLDIADHEFVVLVGPSGCGKSTTLRMIAGLEEITEGEIWIGGDVVNDVPPRDRDIAMVFQNYALYPHMSVFDNMAFGLKLRKFPKAEIKRRVDEAARILDLVPLLDRKPRALSGGQRQRVAMGRAIVRRPKVFLFDEPLSNLDAKLRVQMRTEIKKLHRRIATTVVYVTHDQVEAMTLADRIVVMRAGGIRLGLGGAAVAPAGDWIERELIVGIRPEHFSPGGECNGLAVMPEVVEPLGSDTLVFFRIADAELVARIPPTTPVAVGKPIR